MVILPSSLLVLSMIEMLLFLLYNTKIHPWKTLLVSNQEIHDSKKTSDEDRGGSGITISDDLSDIDIKGEVNKERLRSNLESVKDECISRNEQSSQAETDCSNEKKNLKVILKDDFEKEEVEEKEEEEEMSTKL